MPNHKDNGYRGIWFTLNQFSEYGDKYSGGLATYTAKHVPLAIYAPQVNKTFFVYGGALNGQRHLLAMAAYYDHEQHVVPRPTIVHDKGGVDDPHDNPSIALDEYGHIWVFISGRGQRRPGYKYRSVMPYNVDAFDLVSEEEMTYPQPWWVPVKDLSICSPNIPASENFIGIPAQMVERGRRIKNWLGWADIIK